MSRITEAITDTFYSMLESLEESWMRARFTGGKRIDFYEELAGLIEDGSNINEIMEELYQVASDAGRKPRALVAVIAQDCMTGMANGRPVSRTLQRWINDQEVSLLAAGEASGDMKTALDEAIENIKIRSEIGGAVAMATVYPMFLVGMLVYMLNLVTYTLVPKFGRVLKPDQWQGDALMLKEIAAFVVNYGSTVAILLAFFVVLIIVTMPYLTGTMRIYLDRLPPWSIYRSITGATMLLNTAMMIKAGIKMETGLERQADMGNPYLKERLAQTIHNIGLGQNLGVALDYAGFNFPDRAAIQHIKLLATRTQFNVALQKFAKRWMARMIKRLKLFSNIFLFSLLGLIGYLALMIVSGVYGIQDLIFSKLS